MDCYGFGIKCKVVNMKVKASFLLWNIQSYMAWHFRPVGKSPFPLDTIGWMIQENIFIRRTLLYCPFQKMKSKENMVSLCAIPLKFMVLFIDHYIFPYINVSHLLQQNKNKIVSKNIWYIACLNVRIKHFFLSFFLTGLE